MSDNIEKKQQTARDNGAKSKGPVTPEGKKISSLNGITHGLASKCVVLTNESEEKYDQLLQSYQQQWQPANPAEQHLVIQLTNAYWRLRRVWVMETALLDSEMFCQRADFEAAWSNFHPGMRLDAITAINCANPTTLETLHRYETRYDRLYRGSMDQLLKLRRERKAPAITIENAARPELPPEPQAPEPTPAAPAGLLSQWFAALLVMLTALIGHRFTNFARPTARKAAPKPENPAPVQTEPIPVPETPINQFQLPELFAWETVFTASVTRPKAVGKPPKYV